MAPLPFLCFVYRSEDWLDVQNSFSKPSLHCAAFAGMMFGRLTLPQVLLAGIMGIAGGIYIYQPIFERYSRDQKSLKKKVELTEESEEKRS